MGGVEGVEKVFQAACADLAVIKEQKGQRQKCKDLERKTSRQVKRQKKDRRYYHANEMVVKVSRRRRVRILAQMREAHEYRYQHSEKAVLGREAFKRNVRRTQNERVGKREPDDRRGVQLAREKRDA